MKMLFECSRPKGERLRLTVQYYRGAPRIDLRHWYPDPGGNFRPGRMGMTLPRDAVEGLVAALRVAARVTLGDIPPAAND